MIKPNKDRLAIDHQSLVVKKGYTLIEILVALTIIGLIFSFGYVSFRDYSRRQAFVAVVRNIKGDLRLTQELALSGDKPADLSCNSPNTLTGYRFDITSSTSYAIEAICSGGPTPIESKSVDISTTGVTLSASKNTVLFKSVGQGTDAPAASVTITLTQSVTGSTQTVSVNSGGEIE